MPFDSSVLGGQCIKPCSRNQVSKSWTCPSLCSTPFFCQHHPSPSWCSIMNTGLSCLLPGCCNKMCNGSLCAHAHISLLPLMLSPYLLWTANMKFRECKSQGCTQNSKLDTQEQQSNLWMTFSTNICDNLFIEANKFYHFMSHNLFNAKYL